MADITWLSHVVQMGPKMSLQSYNAFLPRFAYWRDSRQEVRVRRQHEEQVRIPHWQEARSQGLRRTEGPIGVRTGHASKAQRHARVERK